MWAIYIERDNFKAPGREISWENIDLSRSGPVVVSPAQSQADGLSRSSKFMLID